MARLEITTSGGMGGRKYVKNWKQRFHCPTMNCEFETADKIGGAEFVAAFQDHNGSSGNTNRANRRRGKNRALSKRTRLFVARHRSSLSAGEAFHPEIRRRSHRAGGPNRTLI